MIKKTSLILFLTMILCVCLTSVHSYGWYTDYKKVLSDMYQAIDAIIPEPERKCVSDTGGSPVYGEITYEGVVFLLDKLALTSDDIFYDLGSGLGKFTYQVFLTTPAKKSVGIEFSQSRYDRAKSLASQMPKVYKQAFKYENSMRSILGKKPLERIKNKECKFIKGCMIDTDFSDATVIFTCSTCFGKAFMQKLADKCANINKLKIITLKQFPYHEHIRYEQMFQLPMSWAKDVPVYMYVVDQATIAPPYPVDLAKDKEVVKKTV